MAYAHINGTIEKGTYLQKPIRENMKREWQYFPQITGRRGYNARLMNQILHTEKMYLPP